MNDGPLDLDFDEEFSAAAELGTLIDDHSPDETEATTLYRHVGEWMEDWLAVTVDRRLGDKSSPGSLWCDQWWAHDEALNRFYALWQEWESARAESTMSAWWRDHFEPHWQQLTSENGPFRDCVPSTGSDDPVHTSVSRPLPTAPVPAEVLNFLPEGS